MRTVETTVTVTAGGALTLQVPADIPPGEHQAVLVIDELPIPKKQRPPLKFSAYPVGLASDIFTFRREDLYDDGR